MNEMTIHLNAKGKVPLYEQIYAHIKGEIQGGKIARLERLPSTRALSSFLEVSRSTVELAYEQLLSEGYIESIPYKGYFVTQIEELHRFNQKEELIFEEQAKGEPLYQYDFSPNGIDLKSFPYNTWRKLSKDILIDDNTELFRLGDSQGEYDLRCAIVHYLYQSRGVNCKPEQIVVGAGNDYLLMLLSTLLGREHKIAFENPTYRQAYRLFESLSYQVCTVEMDSSGIKVNDLRKTMADVAYVMPSHQYPLGIVMPVKRRMELLNWAEEEETRYIIEDDYDSEFRYKGKPIPALQGSDTGHKVIYIGTFSRAIAPAIRMSYMVLPKPLLKVYQQKSKFMSSTVSKVDQKIVCEFIERGHFERHLNKTRAIYKSRHDTMLQHLRKLSDRCRISGEHAGVHLLLHFFKGEEKELIEKARTVGVKVYGLSGYNIVQGRKREATILLGYANMTEEKMEEAIERLSRVW